MKTAGTLAGLGSVVSGVGAARTLPSPEQLTAAEHHSQQDAALASGNRIATGQRVSPRDFTTRNYERIYTHRKTASLAILLSDPAVNKIARNWVASFEAHEPLTNHIDMIGVQGPRDIQIDGGFDTGFTVTAVDRQTTYGLVDRYTNELLALQVNKPTNATWKEQYSKDQQERAKVILEQPDVQDQIGDGDVYPSFKVGEQITSYEGYPKGESSPVVLFVAKEGGCFRSLRLGGCN